MMTAKEYGKIFGGRGEADPLAPAERVEHECGLCGRRLLLDRAVLRRHLARHHMTKLGDYTSRYMEPARRQARHSGAAGWDKINENRFKEENKNAWNPTVDDGSPELKETKSIKRKIEDLLNESSEQVGILEKGKTPKTAASSSAASFRRAGRTAGRRERPRLDIRGLEEALPAGERARHSDRDGKAGWRGGDAAKGVKASKLKEYWSYRPGREEATTDVGSKAHSDGMDRVFDELKAEGTKADKAFNKEADDKYKNVKKFRIPKKVKDGPEEDAGVKLGTQHHFSVGFINLVKVADEVIEIDSS
jgi:hypothetical protein